MIRGARLHNSIRIPLPCSREQERFNIAARYVHGRVKRSCEKVENFPLYMCASGANGNVRDRVRGASVCDVHTRGRGTDGFQLAHIVARGDCPRTLPHQPSSTATDLSVPARVLYRNPPVCSISDLLRVCSGTPLRYHNIRVRRAKMAASLAVLDDANAYSRCRVNSQTRDTERARVSFSDFE